MIILVMGVTGAGKTTIGSLLAQQLDWEFVDADSFHSPENVEKIRQGIALSDGDHFATEKLLASQFETLEEPEDAVSVDVSRDPEEIVAEIRRKLALI